MSRSHRFSVGVVSEQIVELETDLDATTAERFAEACRFDGLHVEAVVFSFRSIRDVPAQRNRLLIRQQDLPAVQARLARVAVPDRHSAYKKRLVFVVRALVIATTALMAMIVVLSLLGIGT